MSATVLLLRDDPFEVLLVSRAARGAFASALVFPGGAIDPEDHEPGWREVVEDFDAVADEERPLRVGAIRELWEETGILLGGPEVPVRNGQPFRTALQSATPRVRLDALTRFARWITPVTEPRRFDTHFYLALAPAGQDAVPDGSETLAAEWMPPGRAVELAQSGERPIIFPTMMNLALLAESASGEDAIAAAISRRRVTVQPDIFLGDDGERHIRIPSESGYPISNWRDVR